MLEGSLQLLGDRLRVTVRLAKHKATLQRALALNPKYATAPHWYGELLYTMSGRKEEARKIDVEVKRLAEQGYVDAGLLMWIHLHLGETGQVFVRLEKAFAERSTALTLIKVNRRFDPLRADPRFQDLVRRLKFPQWRPPLGRAFCQRAGMCSGGWCDAVIQRHWLFDQ